MEVNDQVEILGTIIHTDQKTSDGFIGLKSKNASILQTDHDTTISVPQKYMKPMDSNQIIIYGKIIWIDPITTNCTIALKDINVTNTQQHDMTISLSQNYIRKQQIEPNNVNESIKMFFVLKTKSDKITIKNYVNNINEQSIKLSWNNLFSSLNINSSTISTQSSQDLI